MGGLSIRVRRPQREERISNSTDPYSWQPATPNVEVAFSSCNRVLGMASEKWLEKVAFERASVRTHSDIFSLAKLFS